MRRLKIVNRILFAVSAVAFYLGAAKPAYAANCPFYCGDCQIWYYFCDSCSGSGCDTVGWNCIGACWDCGNTGKYTCAS
ncbi:MAG TPA: hypothetical protein VFO21_06045 [Vicinamibacterales bacterium]|nr:hypothetical protein [Vicinamibacterales bacterium]